MTPLNELLEMGRAMRILYVEDDEALRQELTLLLSDIFDTLVLASDGLEGLRAFEAESFDLVITDIKMPKMDGIAMIEAIRKINPKQSIIVTSAHNEVEYLIKLIRLGVDNFITKPLSSDHIFETLSKSVRHIYEAKELHRREKELEDFEQNIEAKVEKKSFQLKQDYKITNAYLQAYEKSICTFVLDSNAKILKCTQPMANLLGFKIEELVGCALKSCLHVSMQDYFIDQMMASLNDTAFWSGEITFVDRSMDLRYGLVSVSPLDLLDEPRRFLMSVEDISKWRLLLREKEFAIEQAMDRFSIAKSIENLPLPAVVLDKEGVITYANSEIMELIEEGLDSNAVCQIHEGKLHLWEFISFVDEELACVDFWQKKSITHCEAKYESILGVLSLHIKIKTLQNQNGSFLVLFCYQGVGDDAL